MQPALATERLRLAPLRAGDLDRLAALLAEPGVRRFLCDDQLLPRATVEAVIDRSLALAPQGFGLWGIEAEGWIGCIGLQPVSPAVTAAAPELSGEVEPTVALREAAWGRGHAAEALLAILAHGFGTLGLRRIVAVVDEPNTRSRRLMERAGFTPTGSAPWALHRLVLYECRR